jgi:hypothetical protein
MRKLDLRNFKEMVIILKMEEIISYWVILGVKLGKTDRELRKVFQNLKLV